MNPFPNDEMGNYSKLGSEVNGDELDEKLNISYKQIRKDTLISIMHKLLLITSTSTLLKTSNAKICLTRSREHPKRPLSFFCKKIMKQEAEKRVDEDFHKGLAQNPFFQEIVGNLRMSD